MTSILIAEDDPLLLNLLAQILAEHQDFHVVGTVRSGLDTLEAVTRLQPRVLLLDLHLPELSGRKVLEKLPTLQTRPRVLVLSGDEAEQTQLDTAREGAAGFIRKSEAVPLLAEAIRAVAEGRMWFPEPVVQRILSDYGTLARRLKEQEKPLHQLSEREHEVLLELARGKTNQQIAGGLCMSLGTVKAHAGSILTKLGLPNRTEAAVFAVREGLLEAVLP